jgi:hypothetical protein
MNLRRICAVLLVPATLALAACTSSSSGRSGVSTGVSSPAAAAPGAAALSATLRSGMARVTSAHVDLDITLVGQQLTGAGDEQLRDGKLVALDLTENLPGGSGAIRVIVVDGKTYVKLPSALNPGGKPYLLVTARSSNSVVKQLAGSLDIALSAASLGNLSVFAGAAKSVDVKGREQVAGRPATHYSLTVDIARLPASLPGKAQLAAGGAGTFPLELYVDGRGRPVRVAQTLTVQGQDISSQATVTSFNRPLSVTAPPSTQVGG